jgi:hypothetical protein
MTCSAVLEAQCSQGHQQRWKCHQGPPPICAKCERAAKEAEEKKRRDFEHQKKRDADQREHLAQMAALDENIRQERQELKDLHDKRERERALQQKKKDLENAAALTKRVLSTPAPKPSSTHTVSTPVRPVATAPDLSIKDPKPSNQTSTPPRSVSTVSPPDSGKPFPQYDSPSEKEWQRQKDFENADDNAIDDLMQMIGLEKVKKQVLNIKAKIEVSLRQGSDLKDERFSVVLLGNPGTGMHPQIQDSS